MSRELSKIRSLINEIDEIQKKGQVVPHLQLAKPISSKKDEVVSKPVIHAVSQSLDVPISPVVQNEVTQGSELDSLKSEPITISPAKIPGKISIKLTGEVIVQFEIDETKEIVEVSRDENQIKISFSDGKAVHLPLKSVA